MGVNNNAETLDGEEGQNTPKNTKQRKLFQFEEMMQ